MMIDDLGQLSLDFLIGFTIFMVSFIFVVTLSSGLLIGLQSKTIDYDAVAYRTGVILVEDPGQPSIPSDSLKIDPIKEWELVPDKRNIIRTGLALSKDTPNILRREKIDRFFNGDLSYPDDYRRVLMMSAAGGPQYRFNITLYSPDNPPSFKMEIGDPYSNEQKYGYIRRAVFIKEPTGDVTIYVPGAAEPGDPPTGRINLMMDFTWLYDPIRGSIYSADPLIEPTKITINCPSVIPQTLQEISLYNFEEPDVFIPIAGKECIANEVQVTINGNTPWNCGDEVDVSDITISFPQAYFAPFADKNSNLAIVYKFKEETNPLAITREQSYDYLWIARPPLTPAILEVRVW